MPRRRRNQTGSHRAKSKRERIRAHPERERNRRILEKLQKELRKAKEAEVGRPLTVSERSEVKSAAKLRVRPIIKKLKSGGTSRRAPRRPARPPRGGTPIVFDITQDVITSERGRRSGPAGNLNRMAAPGVIRSGLTGQVIGTQPLSAQDYLLTSTAIRQVRYSTQSHVMQITFVSGGRWNYFNFPELLFRQFINDATQSKGRFFHDNIYGTWKGPKGSKTYTPRYREARA